MNRSTPLRDLAAGVLGVGLHGSVFAVLWVGLGLSAAQAIGVIAVFYLALFPSYILCRFVCALLGERWGGFVAIVAMPIVAAWFAWSLVMHPGMSLDLIEPSATCYDRQGHYAC